MKNPEYWTYQFHKKLEDFNWKIRNIPYYKKDYGCFEFYNETKEVRIQGNGVWCCQDIIKKYHGRAIKLKNSRYYNSIDTLLFRESNIDITNSMHQII